MNLQEALRQTSFTYAKPKRLKTDVSCKQLRSFYKSFGCSLLIISDTPNSYRVLTKRYGYFTMSKQYCIAQGLFIKFIDTWYFDNVLSVKNKRGVKVGTVLKSLLIDNYSTC